LEQFVKFKVRFDNEINLKQFVNILLPLVKDVDVAKSGRETIEEHPLNIELVVVADAILNLPTVSRVVQF
jgi:hypothetical protein